MVLDLTGMIRNTLNLVWRFLELHLGGMFLKFKLSRRLLDFADSLGFYGILSFFVWTAVPGARGALRGCSFSLLCRPKYIWWNGNEKLDFLGFEE